MITNKRDQFRETVGSLTGFMGFGGETKKVQHELTLQGNTSIVQTNAQAAGMANHLIGGHDANDEREGFWDFLTRLYQEQLSIAQQLKEALELRDQLLKELEELEHERLLIEEHLPVDENGNIEWANTEAARRLLEPEELELQDGETERDRDERIRTILEEATLPEDSWEAQWFRNEEQRRVKKEQLDEVDVQIHALRQQNIEQYKIAQGRLIEDRKKAVELSTQNNQLVILLGQMQEQPPDQKITFLREYLADKPELKEIVEQDILGTSLEEIAYNEDNALEPLVNVEEQIEAAIEEKIVENIQIVTLQQQEAEEQQLKIQEELQECNIPEERLIAGINNIKGLEEQIANNTELATDSPLDLGGNLDLGGDFTSAASGEDLNADLNLNEGGQKTPTNNGQHVADNSTKRIAQP